MTAYYQRKPTIHKAYSLGKKGNHKWKVQDDQGNYQLISREEFHDKFEYLCPKDTELTADQLRLRRPHLAESDIQEILAARPKTTLQLITEWLVRLYNQLLERVDK